MIACISLVEHNGKYLAIKDPKRGYILPGGKLEGTESLKACAARELYEEAGFKANQQRLFFQAHCHTGYYVYCFLTEATRATLYSEFETEWVTKSQLMESEFKDYYALMFEVL